MSKHDVLHSLARGQPLSPEQAAVFFGELLAGRLDSCQIAAALAMIQQRGVTVDELVEGARAMRSHMTPVPTDPSWGVVIDTCSTGGAPKTVNVSSIAAIVVASAGEQPGRRRVIVAKHGNTSRTGRGSAEVLAALGVNIDAPVDRQAACLRDVGVCFCFAVRHHPGARHAAPARKALGFPTMFNLLGPLTNPAGAVRQVTGVYRADMAELVALALTKLGCERALVMHSEDGLDELTITAPTHLWNVQNGSVQRELLPLDEVDRMGLRRAPLEMLRARDLPDAVQVAVSVLRGEVSPARDMVLLSAGAALFVGGAVDSLAQGVHAAREAVDTGHAMKTLEQLRLASAV